MSVRDYNFFRGITQCRIVRTEWPPELENTLMVSYNEDLESRMSIFLSQEIGRQIDNEILTRIFNEINNNNNI